MCGPGYFANTGNCDPCHPSCSSCGSDGIDGCTECFSNASLDTDRCDCDDIDDDDAYRNVHYGGEKCYESESCPTLFTYDDTTKTCEIDRDQGSASGGEEYIELDLSTGSSFDWTVDIEDPNSTATDDIDVKSSHRPAMYDTRGAWFDGINDYIELDGLKINGYEFAVMLTFKAENNDSTLFHVPVILDRYNQRNADTESVEIWIDRCNNLIFDVGPHRVQWPITPSTWTQAAFVW